MDTQDDIPSQLFLNSVDDDSSSMRSLVMRVEKENTGERMVEPKPPDPRVCGSASTVSPSLN